MKAEMIKNMYRHDFSSFVGFAHHTLHPYTPYLKNWHIQALAEALNKVGRGEITRLIVNMPPRMGKSLSTSVAFPAWLLGRDPKLRVLCLSGGKTLGRDLHDFTAALMSSPRYKSVFPHLRPQIEANRILTGHGGYRQSLLIEGKMTGLGGDLIIIDDPIDALLAQDDGERRRLNEQFDQNILQRLNSKKTGAIILIMHRVHEGDLTMYLLAKDEGWTHVCMPAIALADECWVLPHGQIYHRKKFEPLHPARESFEQLQHILRSIGGYAFAYQYLQGLYQPLFGRYGEGSMWITPYREGEFWDERKNRDAFTGFLKFKEEDLILPRVFGVGDDPYPPNMRHHLTIEEWEYATAEHRLDPETGVHSYADDVGLTP